MISCLENLEMSENLTDVRGMSGTGEVSGKQELKFWGYTSV